MYNKVEFLYLSQDDCVKAGGLDMKGALKATERSFFLHGKGDFILPPKPVIRWGGEDSEETIGRIMSMPAWLGGSAYKDELEAKIGIGPVNTSGIKFIPSKPWNPAKYNLPRANAIEIIVDPETLMPQAIMDATLVSAMRTGAASGVAAKYLAKPGAKTLTVFGSSVIGKTQLLGVANALAGIERAKVYSPNAEHVKAFVEEMKGKVDVELVAATSYEDAQRGADVICTATMAKSPYIVPEWWDEGVTHIETSFWDTPPEALKYMGKIFADDWGQVKHHGADVSWRAVRDGFIPETAICGNLGQVVTGELPGRGGSKEKIFFNPIGMGIHDLSEAFRVFESAKAQGIGRVLPLWDSYAL
ncbi:MAG: ornithine cyclodeaminase family protein [Clostridiales Family XIII bacterium]|jgi:ornithine cyclodeaminase|nr:ornithine cyclodeaminase family protein [Clostridiales Family XIII bacterium]